MNDTIELTAEPEVLELTAEEWRYLDVYEKIKPQAMMLDLYAGRGDVERFKQAYAKVLPLVEELAAFPFDEATQKKMSLAKFSLTMQRLQESRAALEEIAAEKAKAELAERIAKINADGCLSEHAKQQLVALEEWVSA